MCLPKHTKIQSGQGEGENCKEGVDPAHVQTENCSAVAKVSSSWFSCKRFVCPICIVGISCFIYSVKCIYMMKLLLWCLTICCYPSLQIPSRGCWHPRGNKWRGVRKWGPYTSEKATSQKHHIKRWNIFLIVYIYCTFCDFLLFHESLYDVITQ